MNEKNYISRKYNKLLNILLGIYVTLCLVLSLLYNGFFVKTKAYSNNNNLEQHTWTLSWIQKNNNSAGATTGYINYEPNNNSRGVFVKIDDIDDCVSAYVNGNYTEPLYVFMIEGDSRLQSKTTNMGGITYAPQSINLLNAGSSTYKNYMENLGFNNDDSNTENNIPGLYYMCGSDLNWAITTFHLDDLSNLQYIDNIDDLKSYFLNNDESVVKIGNPTQSNSIVDNSLPLPQNVHFLENTINKDGSILDLAVGWDNPYSASFDALDINKLKVQVQINGHTIYYDGITTKPENAQVYNFTTENEFDLFNPFLKTDCNSYVSRGTKKDGLIGATYDNGYQEYATEDGYINYHDTKIVEYYKSQGISSVGHNIGLVNGTVFKIRYKYEDNVSLWVNLKLAKNPTSWNDLPLYSETSFTDNNGNDYVISSDASGNGSYYNSNPYSSYYNSIVYPNPNSSNKSSNSSSSSSSSSGLGNILSGIGSIFGAIGEFFSGIFTGIGELVSSIKGLFSGENDSGGFFGFFGSLFQEFPFLLTFLTLGIAITVLLRIIGR